MRIRHLSGPKQGIVEHCANDAGRVLVLAGLAEEIKYKNYIERLADKQFVLSDPAAEREYNTVKYSFREKANGFGSMLVKTVRDTTTFFEPPPPPIAEASFRAAWRPPTDVPLAILCEWYLKNSKLNPSAAQLAQATSERMRAEQLSTPMAANALARAMHGRR